MNPLPVGASTTATPPPSAVLSRASTAPNGHRAVARPVALDRGESVRPLSEDGGDDAFAGILADAQAFERREVDAEPETDDGQMTILDVPVEPSPAIGTTPWLLLALAQRTITRSPEAESTSTEESSANDGSAVTNVSPGTGGANVWWPVSSAAAAVAEQVGAVVGTQVDAAGAVPAAETEAGVPVVPATAAGASAAPAELTAEPAAAASPSSDAVTDRLTVERDGGETASPRDPATRIGNMAPRTGDERKAVATAAMRPTEAAVVPPVADASPDSTTEATPAPATAAAREALRSALVQESSFDRGNSAPGGPTVAPAVDVTSTREVVATTRTAPPAAVVPPDVAEQVTSHIVSSIKMQWKDGIGEARLHLRPDAFGSVSVWLRVEQGAVTAVVKAESPQIQEWVVQHQQALRAHLDAAGLRLDELSVSPDDRGQSSDRESEGQPRRRRQTSEDGEDEAFARLL